MSEFAATLRNRVRRIREALHQAWDRGDEEEAAAAYGDLQDMARIGDDHGIDVAEPDQDGAEGRPRDRQTQPGLPEHDGSGRGKPVRDRAD